MTNRETVGLIGFFGGVLLHWFLFVTLLEKRRKRRLEMLLLLLLGTLVVWFAGNFLSFLLKLMDARGTAIALRLVDTVTYFALALLPALLLQSHWGYYSRRVTETGSLGRFVKLAIALSCLPIAALPILLVRIWEATPGQWLAAMEDLKLPFVVLLSGVYLLTAYLCRQVVRRSEDAVEQRFFSILLFVFCSAAVFNVCVFLALPLSYAPTGSWFILIAWNAAMIPSAVLNHHIYQYQFLGVRSPRSLANGLFVLTILVVYLVGVRFLSAYLEQEYGARGDLLDALFFATVLLLFPPLSRWFEDRVDKMFSGEIRKYRELGEMIHRAAPLPDAQLFSRFVEERLERELGTSRVRIHLGESDTSPREGFYPLRTADRTIGFVEISQPQTNKKAEPEAMHFLANEIAVAIDRCDSLAAQLTLERTLAQRSHMEELGRMAATVAHNVKNPLSSIKTLMQLMKEAPNLTADQATDMDMMIHEVNRLAGTVSQLLRFSRLEGKEGGAKKSVMDLADFARSVRTVFAGDLKKRQLDIKIVASTENLRVEADPDMLSDILTNLVSNAIESSPAGSTIKIKLVAAGQSGYQILVEDEGPGIPAHIRDTLFEPFVTAKSRGTGLGLAIVKKRVGQLNGQVEFVSPIGTRGTRFVVTLPVLPSGQDAREPSAGGTSALHNRESGGEQ